MCTAQKNPWGKVFGTRCLAVTLAFRMTKGGLQPSKTTPLKINMDIIMEVLVPIIFRSKWVICRFHVRVYLTWINFATKDIPPRLGNLPPMVTSSFNLSRAALKGLNKISENWYMYPTRKLTWIPKMLGWKRQLRLQTWLFCGESYVRCQGCRRKRDPRSLESVDENGTVRLHKQRMQKCHRNQIYFMFFCWGRCNRLIVYT